MFLKIFTQACSPYVLEGTFFTTNDFQILPSNYFLHRYIVHCQPQVFENIARAQCIDIIVINIYPRLSVLVNSNIWTIMPVYCTDVYIETLCSLDIPTKHVSGLVRMLTMTSVFLQSRAFGLLKYKWQRFESQFEAPGLVKASVIYPFSRVKDG